MHGTVNLSSLDTALLMAPFAILLVSVMFGLDERFVSGPGRHGHRPKFCEVGRDGRGELRDPDGNAPKRDALRQGPARRRGNRFVTRYDRASSRRRAGFDLP